MKTYIVVIILLFWSTVEGYDSHGRKYCTDEIDENFAGREKPKDQDKDTVQLKGVCPGGDCLSILVLLPAEGSVFPCCGYITHWEAAFDGGGQVWFIVFRPTNPLLNQFIVHATDGPFTITPKKVGKCDKADWRQAAINTGIRVQAGDFLGFYMIPEDANDCGSTLMHKEEKEKEADYRNFMHGMRTTGMTDFGFDMTAPAAGYIYDADDWASLVGAQEITDNKQKEFSFAIRADVRTGANPTMAYTGTGYTSTPPAISYVSDTEVTLTVGFADYAHDLFSGIAITDSDPNETLEPWMYVEPFTETFELIETAAGSNQYVVRLRDESTGTQSDTMKWHLTDQTYTITIGGYDNCGKDTANNVVLTVNIIASNGAPVFITPDPSCVTTAGCVLPAICCPNYILSKRLYKTDDLIFKFFADDPDGQAITYSEVVGALTNPANDGTFQTDANGYVWLKRNPFTDAPPSATYTIAAIATDTGGLTATSKPITITWIDTNNPPVMQNLPTSTTIKILETEDSQQLLFSAIAIDPDTTSWGDQVSYTWTGFEPSSATLSNAFTTTSDGKVWLKNGAVSKYGMDYEGGVNAFTTTVYASDNNPGGTTIAYSVKFEVVNVNERPYWQSGVDYKRTISEGSKVQTIIRMSNYVVDPDNGDSRTYTLVSPYPFLTINFLSGEVRTFGGYEIDVDGDELPEQLDFGVVVRDFGGLAAMQTVQLLITDINDNAPIFSAKNDYVLRPITRMAGPIGNAIEVTDRDKGINGKFNYRLVGDNSFSQASEYLSVNTLGNGSLSIVAKKYLDFDWDYEYYNKLQKLLSFTILAIDEGVPALTGSAEFSLDLTILLCDWCTTPSTTTTPTTTTTTTTTTTPPPTTNATSTLPPAQLCECIFCCELQKILLGVLIVGFLTAVGVTSYIMWGMLTEKPKGKGGAVWNGIRMR